MLFDHARALFGPLPLVLCRAGTFIRVFCGSKILILSLTITGTKFFFVCIFQSIPLMDDNFLSFVINTIVNVIMLLATMSKFYLEDIPNVAEVIKQNISNPTILYTANTGHGNDSHFFGISKYNILSNLINLTHTILITKALDHPLPS